MGLGAPCALFCLLFVRPARIFLTFHSTRVLSDNELLAARCLMIESESDKKGALVDVVVDTAPQSVNGITVSPKNSVDKSMSSSARVVAGDGCPAEPVKKVNSVNISMSSSARVNAGDGCSADPINASQINRESEALTQSQSQSKRQYSSVVKRSGLPAFDQSVICDRVEGASNDDYMDEFEKISSIGNLRFFSKISNNKVLFTVNSAEVALKLVNSVITIKGQKLLLRPYVSTSSVNKYRRIVISNVLPHIPNDLITDKLKDLGIFLERSITNVRCSTGKDWRKHVQSHRRQFYLKEEDAEKLPSKIQVVFQDTPYWIFLEADEIKCHFCNALGHIAKYCPKLHESQKENNSNEASETPPSPLVSPVIPSDASSPHQDNESIASDDTLFEIPSQVMATMEFEESPQCNNEEKTLRTGIKRTAPSSTAGSSRSDVTKPYWFKEPKTRRSISKKKLKKQVNGSQLSRSCTSESDSESGDYFDVNDLAEALEPVKDLFEKPEVNTPMNFDKFVKYLTEIKGKRNVIEITEPFTEDVPGLITFLDISTDLISDLNTRNRLKSLKRRLNKAIDIGSWPTDAKKLAPSEEAPVINQGGE